MSKKAVDIVLLPTEAMMDKAIEANRQLVEKFGREIVLNKETYLPHISLAMGCIDEKDITAVGEILETTAKECSIEKLRVIGTAIATNAQGQKVSAFAVEKTRQLQSLHEQVMTELAPYLSYDATADMVNAEQVAESTLLWINYYREKSSFAKFLPHITIGYGELEKSTPPIEFAASSLALCHLGNHCTCTEILASARLS